MAATVSHKGKFVRIRHFFGEGYGFDHTSDQIGMIVHDYTDNEPGCLTRYLIYYRGRIDEDYSDYNTLKKYLL